MNGILHSCTHPSDDDYTLALTEKDMVLGEAAHSLPRRPPLRPPDARARRCRAAGLFRYIDRIVKIVRPKKLMYLAVDGVAPRAKLNQQRARRFRSAKERTEATEKAREAGELSGDAAVFDSNCITPGTDFMDTFDRHLQYFIRKKLKEDPVWQPLTIIYSGHNVPGEGEHKIIHFIRTSKEEPGYQPNVRHCMCGLDADLVMLSLASHEPHFALLREEIDFKSFLRVRSAARARVRARTRSRTHAPRRRAEQELDEGGDPAQPGGQVAAAARWRVPRVPGPGAARRQRAVVRPGAGGGRLRVSHHPLRQ